MSTTSSARETILKYNRHFRSWREYKFDQYSYLKTVIEFSIQLQSINKNVTRNIEKAQENILKFAEGGDIHMTILPCCVIDFDERIDNDNLHEYADLQLKEISLKEIFKVRIRIQEKYLVKYFDDRGRMYKDWEDYINNNKCPKGVLVLPKDGKFSGTCHNNTYRLNLDTVLSPESRIKRKVKKVFGFGSGAAGLAASGVFIASVFTPIGLPLFIAAVVAAVGSSSYGIGSAAHVLVDRAGHQESIGLNRSEARQAWLNIFFNAATGVSSAFVVGRFAILGRGIIADVVTATVTSGIKTVNAISDEIFTQDNMETERLKLNKEFILLYYHCDVDVEILDDELHKSINNDLFDVHRPYDDDFEEIKQLRKINDKKLFITTVLRKVGNLNRNHIDISFSNAGQYIYKELEKNRETEVTIENDGESWKTKLKTVSAIYLHDKLWDSNSALDTFLRHIKDNGEHILTIIDEVTQNAPHKYKKQSVQMNCPWHEIPERVFEKVIDHFTN